MRLLKILFVFFLVLIPLTYALTASIGNAKMILRPEVIEGKRTIIDKTIKVNNVNDIPVNITLEPQGDLVGIVEIFDKNFILQPGETRNAMFRISLDYGGYYEGKIGVKFTSLEGGHGVGLSSTIIIIAEGPPNPNPEIEPVNTTMIVNETSTTNNETNNETGTGVNVRVGGNQDNQGTPTGAATQPVKKSIIPIIIGIIIIMTIVVVGMAIYLLLMRG